jgi:serine/threonine protein kinase
MPVKFKCTHEPPKDFAQELKVGEEAGEVIGLCLKIDPSQRPSTAQLLAHPFFAGVSDEPFDVR